MNCRRLRNNGNRQKAFWGAFIPAAIGLAGSIINASSTSEAQRAAMREQQRIREQEQKRMQMEQAATNLNNYFNTVKPEEEYIQYSNGGRRRLRNAGVMLTDGGPVMNLSTGRLVYPGEVVTPGKYKNLGVKHNQKNAEGKEGTGWITGSGKRFETEGGEVEEVRPDEVMVFSNRAKKDGISYADRALLGENPEYLMREQLYNKRHRILDRHSSRPKGARGAIFYTPDYIGLGANIAGSLLSNIYANSAYDNLKKNLDYTIPSFVEEAYVAGPTKVDDSAKKAAIRRRDINARNSILRNTASSNVGLGRSQQLGTQSMYDLMAVAEDTENKNINLRAENANRQQVVRARNAYARNQYYKDVADIKNQNINTKLGINQAKINSNIGMIQGIGSSIGGFLQQGIDNYQASQARKMQISTSPYGTAERMYNMGVDFTKDEIMSQLNDAQLRMDKYQNDETEAGIKSYNEALDSYNLWNNALNSRKDNSFINKLRRLFKPRTRTIGSSIYSGPSIWYNPITGQGQG